MPKIKPFGMSVVPQDDSKDVTAFDSFRYLLCGTSSRIDKERILKNATSFQKKVLLYTYHPFWTYGVSLEKSIKSEAEGDPVPLFVLLDKLRDRTYTGRRAQNEVKLWFKKYGALIGLILNKDLECGVGPETILKVFPRLFPRFSIALGYPKEDILDLNHTWYASRKMDGVRCILIKEGNEVQTLSRKGLPLTSLNFLKKAALSHPMPSFVLDGELALMNPDGTEDFRGCVSAVKKKNKEAMFIVMKIFDYIPVDLFKKAGGEGPSFYERQKVLKSMMDELGPHFSRIRQIPVISEDQLKKMAKKATRRGWEGLIIRKDTSYKGMRTKDIWKVKEMHEAEYKIIGYELGDMYPPKSKQKKKKVLKNVHIRHKGNLVRVGSGWNWEDRVRYSSNPDVLIGQVITVQYFEETHTKHGFSLRFPIMKILHGKKRML